MLCFLKLYYVYIFIEHLYFLQVHTLAYSIKLNHICIFLPKAVEKVLKIGHKYPMEVNVDDVKACWCVPFNESEYEMNSTDWHNVSAETCTEVC